ncbi:hypothetical protein Tco_0304905 [Tanacetum coccineum]
MLTLIFIESTNVIIQTTPRGRSLVSIAVYYEVTPHLVFRCVVSDFWGCYKEEHLASADSVPPIHRITARISIRDEPSISLPPREEVERLLALTTPPPSPLTPLSSPLPHIPSPPLPASPPASVLPASPPARPILPLGYRAAMIRLRAETPSTSHPLPLPTSSPPFQLLSSDRRTDRPEITLPPRKRLGIDLGPRYEIGDSSAAAATRPIGGHRADYGFFGTMDTEIRRQRAEEVGYGIRDVWVDPREAVEEVALMTLEGANTRYHYETARLLDQEALVSREAWGRSIEVSYMTRLEILALRSVVIGQQAVISQLQAADRKSQVVTLEMLQADYQRQVQLAKALKLLKGLQTQMVDYAMQPVKYYGLFPSLARLYRSLFCLATQYRSFVQERVAEGLCKLLVNASYPNFLKIINMTSRALRGVVGLTQWFEKMESVYSISNCTVACQVKFATCTLQGNALTWWNSHVKTTTLEAAHAMP